MPAQTKVNKERLQRERMDELAGEDAKATSQAAGSDHITVEEIDDWLDSIDEALGDEIHFAQAFWAGFVQKGGE